MDIARDCWCGSSDLVPFGPEYRECRRCGTLVSARGLSDAELTVMNDEADFYGKDYWLGHQQQDLGFPDIHARARGDLTERNLHWLRTLLQYRLPPAKTLEIGSAHGSFVALMRLVGYDASGVELSPWVVEFSRRTFDIPALLGPVESLALSPGSLDVVVLMDVFEHLPHPASTMRRCLELVREDGLLLIQTPKFREGTSFQELAESGDPFLEQLKSDEHLYLFSPRSIVQFFDGLGAGHCRFEPAIFDQYDMFLAVSRQPLRTHAEAEIEQSLLASTGGRVGLALLDLSRREHDLIRHSAALETDLAARDRQTEALTGMAREAQALAQDANTRSGDLNALLEVAEKDRAARGEQISQLDALLRESERDRAARGEQIETLTAMATTAQSDKQRLGEQVSQLNALFRESERDRAARAEQIKTLTAMATTAQSDKQRLGEQVSQLNALFRESERDRATRAEQIKTLTAIVTAEQSARKNLAAEVSELDTLLRESERNRAAQTEHISALTATVTAVESARQAQISRLSELLQESEQDRAARAEQIETLTTMVKATEAARQDLRQRLSRLQRQISSQRLRTIAVDLTPVLPGGENGGLKYFALELVRELALRAPQTRFVLLTHARSHEELKALERNNVVCLKVLDPVAENSYAGRLRKASLLLLRHLPGRLRQTATHVRFRVGSSIKRRASGSLLRQLSADLLFCPFTAPVYHDPAIPTVCTICDTQYMTYPEFFAPEDVAQRNRCFMEACHRATAIASISDYTRDAAIEHGGAEPERVHTIHLRLAQKAPEAAEESAALRPFGLTRGRYLIYPANFWMHKNHEMLFTAFGMACRGRLPGDVKLVCTGANESRRAWLIRSAREMGLEARIVFPGFVPRHTLVALIANSSGLVFPSLYEGFGLPVLEAMAMGVPVACSDRAALPETASGSALLFDPRVPVQIADAMVKLVTDQTTRDHLVEAGRKRSLEFSDKARMAAEYWELFEWALANERNESSLSGAYADGWAGPGLRIQVGSSEGPRKLEVQFFAPEWLPLQKLTISTESSRSEPEQRLEIARGSRQALSIPVDADSGSYQFTIAPTFVPAASGHGDDTRELSLMVEHCRLVGGDGVGVELFPARTST
jgi:glycosyltransferase involved in cell wall biosynthesis/SAM-dependent methyltransferase